MGNNSSTAAVDQMKQTEQRYYQPSAMNYEEESKKDDVKSAAGTEFAKVQLVLPEDKQQDSEQSQHNDSIDLSKMDIESQQKRHVHSPSPKQQIKNTQADDKNSRSPAKRGGGAPPDIVRGRHGQKHTADKSDQKLVNNYYDDNFTSPYQTNYQYQIQP